MFGRRLLSCLVCAFAVVRSSSFGQTLEPHLEFYREPGIPAEPVLYGGGYIYSDSHNNADDCSNSAQYPAQYLSGGVATGYGCFRPAACR